MQIFTIFSLFTPVYASVNLEFQVDGNTSDSAVEVDVKYQPAHAVLTQSPLPTATTVEKTLPIPTSSSSRDHNSALSGTKAWNLQTHTIRVGLNDELTFTPNQVEASVGDILIFIFESGNHTLTQSSLEEPCKSTGAFDTGFAFAPDSTSRNVTLLVHTSNPMWFFCRQSVPTSHCLAGMVFAINPGHRMADYLKSAMTAGSADKNTTHTSVHRNSVGTSTVGSAISFRTASIRPSTNATEWTRSLPIPTPLQLVSRSARDAHNPINGKKSRKLGWIAAAIIVTVLVKRVVRERQ